MWLAYGGTVGELVFGVSAIMFNAGNLQRHRFHVSVGLARVDAHWLGLRMNRHMMLPLHWNMERACAISWLTSGPCGSTGMARLSRMRTRMASHPPHCDSVKIYSIQVLVGGPLRWETAATVIQAVTSTCE